MCASPVSCPQCGAAIEKSVFSDEAPLCPHCGAPTTPSTADPVDAELVDPPTIDSGREVYNVVTDIAAGPNVRLKDNLYQAVAILVATVLGVIIGLLVSRGGAGGAIAGAAAGLLIGLLGSGAFLMVYRFVRHVSGKHD